MEAVIRPVMPEDLFDPGDGRDPGEPDGPVRDRRTPGRHGPDGTQDHRRHLRRVRPRTAAAPSPARTRRRSTVPPPTPRRWVAKNLVAAGLAGRCLVQVAYAIGVAHPVSVMVETFGTARVDPDDPRRAGAGALRPEARRHHPRPGTAQTHLREDRGVRPLRPPRARVRVGGDLAGRGPPPCRRLLVGRRPPADGLPRHATPALGSGSACLYPRTPYRP